MSMPVTTIFTTAALLVPLAAVSAAGWATATTPARTVASPEVAPGPAVSTVLVQGEIPSRGRLGGVAVGPDGEIYVANFSASVWRISPSGELTLLDSSLQGSSGNTVDRAGNLYQASFVDGRIVRIGRDGGRETWVVGGLDGPVGLAAGRDGSLYVCNCRGNSISRVRPPDGRAGSAAAGDAGGDTPTPGDRSAPGRTAEPFLTHPDLDCPNGIALDGDGRLVVVSFKNGVVLEVSPQGRARRIAELPGGGNAHVAVVGDVIYVTKIESNRIYRVTRGGSYGPFAGSGELGLADGPLLEATLARPNGIAPSPDGRFLYVNNLVGRWRGEEPTSIVLRRIELGR